MNRLMLEESDEGHDTGTHTHTDFTQTESEPSLSLLRLSPSLPLVDLVTASSLPHDIL